MCALQHVTASGVCDADGRSLQESNGIASEVDLRSAEIADINTNGLIVTHKNFIKRAIAKANEK